MSTLRFKMVEEAIGRKAVEVKAPAERPAEYFGKYVFDRDKMRKYLPKACFETLMNTMKNGSPLDRETADCVAAGMKQWAQDMGVFACRQLSAGLLTIIDRFAHNYRQACP